MSCASRRLVLAALALAPAGCTGLLPTGGAPPRLFTLTPARDFPAGGRRVSWQLLVDVPASAAALDTDRVALSRSATSIDYFADSAWAERAPLMVQSLLVQSFENSSRITAVARESLGLRADYILQPELRHFEAQYAGGGAPVARVELGVKLVKMPERSIVAGWHCETTAGAAQNQVPAIVDAFDSATRDALRQIVEWTLSAAG
jgi:cholesterol transport system auxiliary component